MIKDLLGLLFLSVFSAACVAQSQGASQNDCDATVQAIETQRTVCADFNEHLNFLRIQISSLESEREALRRQCAEDNRPDAKSCQDLAALAAGRLSILQQDYSNLAQRGCQAPTA